MKISNMSGLTGILFLLVTFWLVAESIGKSAGESSAANFESLPSSIGKLTTAGVGCTAVAISPDQVVTAPIACSVAGPAVFCSPARCIICWDSAAIIRWTP